VVRAIHAKWISPVIGPKPVRELTRDHVEDVRDKLDRAIDAGEIRPATGHGVWAALTSALKAACASRDRSLRVQPPKTAQGQRLIPIHPNLLPILVAMKGKNSETVGTFPAGDYGLAGSFRMYLARAGVTRSRLTADNATLSHRSAQEGGVRLPRGHRLALAIASMKTEQARRLISLQAQSGREDSNLRPLDPQATPSDRTSPILEGSAGSSVAVVPDPGTSTPENVPSGPAFGPANAPHEATDLERAIARLTRALTVAGDEDIAAIVAERRAMRAELEALRVAEAGNVVVFGPTRTDTGRRGSRRE
jgi:hypothetical protein